MKKNDKLNRSGLENRESQKKKQILLPNTEFSLWEKPKFWKTIVRFWEEKKIFSQLKERAHLKKKKSFLLHDGPIYANGPVHLGHVLNHLLKDIVVRYYALSGFHVPYIMGWDTHGLPIEQKVLQKFPNFDISERTTEFRLSCRNFALEQVEIQKRQLKDLGLFTNYDDFYLTLNNSYQAAQLRVFGKMVEKGLIFRDHRPLLWSFGFKTALAENEVEYLEKEDYFVYFKQEINLKEKKKTFLVLWTTQPWTIPENRLIALSKNTQYILVGCNSSSEYLIISQDCFSRLLVSFPSWEKIRNISFEELIYKQYKPSFSTYEGKIIDGTSFIKINEGTSLVHLAPSFGIDDFNQAKKENISFSCSLDTDGRFNSFYPVASLVGKFYSSSNEEIIKILKEKDLLLLTGKFKHQYPHDWRDKKPLVYLLTKQWFVKVSFLKEQLLDNIKKVEWFPAWSKEKMLSVMSARNDWCISRQRKWGVPIPVVYYKQKTLPEHNDEKEEFLLDKDFIEKVANLVEKNGSDGWFDGSFFEILKKGFLFLNENVFFGTDTLDVWFDSGASFFCSSSSDFKQFSKKIFNLYLEGSDQFRGWFNSSMIISTIIQNESPYRSVLSHGFVVDENGEKMSKSIGNVISPEKILEIYNPDILRLWVVSSDFIKEIKIGPEILQNLKESYQKIRNTFRFLLGNINVSFLGNFVGENNLIDEYIKFKLFEFKKKSEDNYKNFRFHLIFSDLVFFCSEILSSFFFEINKAVLYCEEAFSPLRQQVLTTFFLITRVLLGIIAPFLPFLSEEIYSYLPNDLLSKRESIWLDNSFSFKYDEQKSTISLEEIIFFEEFFFVFRERLFKLIEKARENKSITHQKQSVVLFLFKEKINDFYLKTFQSLDLKRALSIAEIEFYQHSHFVPPLNLKFTSFSSDFPEYCIYLYLNPDYYCCNRCKNYSTLNQKNSLCQRCSEVVFSWEE